MANTAPQNSVWTAMNYKPPRGRCNYKTSILSSCPCLRFMLHPVKAATSFECDGCGHHASYHDLENQAEDTILKKWSEQEEAKAATEPTKKRRRIAEKPVVEEQRRVFEIEDDVEIVASGVTAPIAKGASRKKAVTK